MMPWSYLTYFMTSNSIFWHDKDYFHNGKEVNVEDPLPHRRHTQP